jgi:hypothetical protein
MLVLRQVGLLKFSLQRTLIVKRSRLRTQRSSSLAAEEQKKNKKFVLDIFGIDPVQYYELAFVEREMIQLDVGIEGSLLQRP